MTAHPGGVSVVIITRDRRDGVMEVLPHLAALPERPPVIVVDNASSDGTVEAVRVAHPGVTVLPLDENRGAAARTVGVRAAATPYVAFSDDDSWWGPGALDCAGSLLSAHPQVGGEETLLAVDLARRGWSCAYVDDLVAHHHPSPVRDVAARRAREVRNELWTLWLRRRLGTVATGTGRTLGRLGRPEVRAGFRQALAGLPWLLGERRPVPVTLERQLRLLG